MSEKQLSIRLAEHEMKILERSAKMAKRTKTDVIREFIRTLSQKPSFKDGALDPLISVKKKGLTAVDKISIFT
jgi:hypothetical protein